MSENTNVEPNSTAVQPVTNAPAAVNVDMDAIAAKATEQAEKKMQAVFRSMLEQQGLDTDAINSITAEWKAKQKTPEQIAAEKDNEINRLQGLLDKAEQDKIIDARRSKLQSHLKAAGANPDYCDLLESEFDIAALEDEGDTFKGWADLLAPVKTKRAGLFGTVETKGADVANPPQNTGGNAYESKLKKAREEGNTAEAIRIKQEAHENGVVLI